VHVKKEQKAELKMPAAVLSKDHVILEVARAKRDGSGQTVSYR
jgi:hypothetical protein